MHSVFIQFRPLDHIFYEVIYINVVGHGNAFSLVYCTSICAISVSDIKFKMAVNCAGKVMLSKFLTIDHIFHLHN